MKRDLCQQNMREYSAKRSKILDIRCRIADHPEVEACVWHNYLTARYDISRDLPLTWTVQTTQGNAPITAQDVWSSSNYFTLGTENAVYTIVPCSGENVSIYTGDFEITLTPDHSFPHEELPVHLQEVFCILGLFRHIPCDSWSLLPQLTVYTRNFYASKNSPYNHILNALRDEPSLLPTTPSPAWPVDRPGLILSKICNIENDWKSLLENGPLFRETFRVVVLHGPNVYTLNYCSTITATGRRRAPTWVLQIPSGQLSCVHAIVTNRGFKRVANGRITDELAFTRDIFPQTARRIVYQRLKMHNFDMVT